MTAKLLFCDKNSLKLFLEPKLLYERTVCTLIAPFEILHVLAAIGNKAQKSTARVFVLVVFAQMSRKLLNTTSENRDLYLWRARISVMTLGLSDFVELLALRKHDQDDSTFQTILQ